MLRAGTRLLAATITAAAFAVAAVGTAQAAPTLTPAGPYTAPAHVTVSGTVPAPFAATAATYTIGECNVSGAPATWGQRCNGTPGASTNFAPLISGAYSGTITIDDSYFDVDFSGQTNPLTTTTCKDIGSDQCAVIVSFYRHLTGGGVQQIGADLVNVTFH